jgi:hypothetical protein
MKTYKHLWRYLAGFYLELETSQANLRRKQNKCLCSATFFENLTVYEVMWTNVVQSDRPQMAIKYRACALYVE